MISPARTDGAPLTDTHANRTSIPPEPVQPSSPAQLTSQELAILPTPLPSSTSRGTNLEQSSYSAPGVSQKAVEPNDEGHQLTVRVVNIEGVAANPVFLSFGVPGIESELARTPPINTSLSSVSVEVRVPINNADLVLVDLLTESAEVLGHFNLNVDQCADSYIWVVIGSGRVLLKWTTNKQPQGASVIQSIDPLVPAQFEAKEDAAKLIALSTMSFEQSTPFASPVSDVKPNQAPRRTVYDGSYKTRRSSMSSNVSSEVDEEPFDSPAVLIAHLREELEKRKSEGFNLREELEQQRIENDRLNVVHSARHESISRIREEYESKLYEYEKRFEVMARSSSIVADADYSKKLETEVAIQAELKQANSELQKQIQSLIESAAESARRFEELENCVNLLNITLINERGAWFSDREKYEVHIRTLTSKVNELTLIIQDINAKEAFNRMVRRQAVLMKTDEKDAPDISPKTSSVANRDGYESGNSPRSPQSWKTEDQQKKAEERFRQRQRHNSFDSIVEKQKKLTSRLRTSSVRSKTSPALMKDVSPTKNCGRSSASSLEGRAQWRGSLTAMSIQKRKKIDTLNREKPKKYGTLHVKVLRGAFTAEDIRGEAVVDVSIPNEGGGVTTRSVKYNGLQSSHVDWNCELILYGKVPLKLIEYRDDKNFLQSHYEACESLQIEVLVTDSQHRVFCLGNSCIDISSLEVATNREATIKLYAGELILRLKPTDFGRPVVAASQRETITAEWIQPPGPAPAGLDDAEKIESSLKEQGYVRELDASGRIRNVPYKESPSEPTSRLTPSPPSKTISPSPGIIPRTLSWNSVSTVPPYLHTSVPPPKIGYTIPLFKTATGYWK